MKRFLIAFLAVIFTLPALSGCFLFDIPQNPILDYDFSEMKLIQLEEPYEGQPIFTVYTTLGEFSAMLFPDDAPNTVENFISRAEEGFYDNKPVFAVKETEYFITGALNDEGTQGVTSDGNLIPNEYSVNLWPFKGAVMAFSGKQGFGDSRFFTLGSVPFEDRIADEMRNAVRRDGSKLIPDELIQAFQENPNIAEASGGYTIFAQVYNGFDVLDKILTLKSDEDSLRPFDEILVEKIELSEYYSKLT
ncbi:MAG: peptidylprolyl isomerase [Oscillospiraceae bacterium]|nr:peptidylprolyl isomerase [Oscillospiraceae bacterium]